MKSDPIIAPLGLYTAPNQLALPRGALTKAKNAVMRRPGVIEPARGYANYATAIGGAPNRLGTYKNTILAQYGASSLARFVGGVKTDYVGDFTPPTGAKTRFVQAGGVLFVTTSQGVKKLDSLAGSLISAGMPRAPGIAFATLNSGSSNPHPDGKQCAYRTVLGIKDATGRIILGEPSGRYILSNAAGAARVASLQIIWPPDSKTTWFVQVYRSEYVANGTEPSDEMALVLEYQNAVVGGRSVTLTDATPETVRGPYLYTNPSQEGALLAAAPPPIATDLEVFQSQLFASNTTAKQRLLLRLLSTDAAAGGVRINDLLTINGQSYRFSSTSDDGTTPRKIRAVTAGSVADNVRQTAELICRVINMDSNNTRLTAVYVSSYGDFPGSILIEESTVGGAAFSATADTYAAPVSGGGLSRAGATVTVSMAFAEPHGLAVGDQVALASATPHADFPVGTKLVVATPTASTWTYTEAGAAVAGGNNYTAKRVASSAPGKGYLPELPTAGDAVSSKNDAAPHRVFFSKIDEPEAFPLVQYFDIGSSERKILRTIQIGSSLFFFKEVEGLYRLSGADAATFRLEHFDPTVDLIGPETVVVLDNTIFALTRKGVVRISEAGVSAPISGPIESDLFALLTATVVDQVRAKAHAVAYESEGLYQLFLPSGAATEADHSYLYNLKANAWTKGTKAATAGVVHPTEDKLYLGQSGSSISVERKVRDFTDIQDEAGAALDFEVQFAPYTDGNPATSKTFKEVVVLLDGARTSAPSLKFATDLSPAEETVALAVDLTLSTGPVRAEVPLEKQQGAFLRVALSNVIAQEVLAIAGIAIVTDERSERVRR